MCILGNVEPGSTSESLPKAKPRNKKGHSTKRSMKGASENQHSKDFGNPALQPKELM